MKGIVFGQGYLGTKVASHLGYLPSTIRITDRDSLMKYLSAEKPDVVVNAAGVTGRPNIDWCEENKEDTMYGNVIVPALLSDACARLGIYLVHLGSGCLYEGHNDGKGFSEADEPNFYGPQFYAKTKILSEKILAENKNSLQLRIRMPVGDEPHHRNFIDKVTKYSKLIDTQNSMTSIPHFLDALKTLVSQRKTGIYNMVNPGTMSTAEVVAMYKQIVDPNHAFEVISLSTLDSMTKARRSNCELDTKKLQEAGVNLPHIRDAVRECLIEYKNKLN